LAPLFTHNPPFVFRVRLFVFCFQFDFILSNVSAPDVFSCEDLPVGQHPVAPNACETYFYQVCPFYFLFCTIYSHFCLQCTEGVDEGIRLNCSDGTWFDATSDQCLFARDIEACGGVATTTIRTTTMIHDDFTRAR
jgi:hypothetical protein